MTCRTDISETKAGTGTIGLVFVIAAIRGRPGWMRSASGWGGAAQDDGERRTGGYSSFLIRSSLSATVLHGSSCSMAPRQAFPH